MMSNADLLKQLPRLNQADRERALKISARIDALEAELNALLQAPGTSTTGLELRDRGIDEDHARELRARLKTFAEDWDRPEAAIYDEDPAR